MSQVRAFVAVDLPESLRSAIEERTAALKSDVDSRAARWVRSASIHLTLKFLGEVDVARLRRVEEVLGRVAPRHPTARLEVGGLGGFPRLDRPRVIWVGVRDESGILGALQAELEEEIAQLGFAKEARAYHPHLTLARVRGPLTPSALEALRRAAGGGRFEALGMLPVQEVCLFRSDLRPTGAVYTRLAAVSLGREGV